MNGILIARTGFERLEGGNHEEQVCAAPDHSRRGVARRSDVRARPVPSSGLSDESGEDPRALFERCGPLDIHAHHGRQARESLGPAGDRRLPARCERLHRHRGGEKRGARRPRAAHRQQRARGDQPGAVQEAALRHGEGLRAGGDDLPHAVFHNGEDRRALPDGAGAHRGRESQPGQAYLWRAVCRQPVAPRRRRSRIPHGHEDGSRAVQGPVANLRVDRERRSRLDAFHSRLGAAAAESWTHQVDRRRGEASLPIGARGAHGRGGGRTRRSRSMPGLQCSRPAARPRSSCAGSTPT